MTFSLSILNPEKVIFEDQVYSVIVPGVEGYLEILAHHAPLISLIQPGKLTITKKNQEKLIYAVSTGFLEVSQNKASVLVDAIEPPEGIDIERAQSAYTRALKRIDTKEKNVDLARAKRSLRRAENRISIFKEHYPDSDNF